MTQRLRIILPPSAVLIAFAVPFPLSELLLWFIGLWWGVILPPPGLLIGRFIVVFAALAYGVYRVVAFHPVYRPDYHVWLARTPWTRDKPLPAGPVSWVWEDGLILGGLAALAQIDGHLDPVLIVTLPLMSYATYLTRALFLTGSGEFAYATAFVLGLAVWLEPNRWACLVAAVGANLLGQIGFRRSLTGFPWYFGWQIQWWQFLTPKTGEDRSRTPCGWPYDMLRPELSDLPRIDLRDAALVSLLAGWWLFALCSLIPDPLSRGTTLVVVQLLGTAAFFFGRLILYCNGYSPPINVWGRIVTFRWIIPGYDQVYVGPLCTVLVPCVGLAVLKRWGVPEDVAFPVCFALMSFVALSFRPSLRRWRLTGRYRISPALDKNRYIQVG
jgi:hypothetical protein